MTESYRFTKSDFGSRSHDDADLPFLRKKFPTRFVVKAYRQGASGEGRDPGLEQHFEPADARAFKDAKAYATSICEEGTASSAEVVVEVLLPPHYYIRNQDRGGWQVAVTDAFQVEAGPTEIDLAEEALREARRRGHGVFEAEMRLRELKGGGW